jgi:hypothetical protein
MATLADALRGYTPPTTSALADPIVEHFRTLPQQLATNQAAMNNTLGSWNKTDFGTGQPNPNYRPEAINELTQMMPNIGALTAWHGTPHAIKGAFDISKIGTGEGAQAYGHGMYFAENPKVSEYYKNLADNVLYTKEGEVFNVGNELKHPNIRATLYKTKDVDSAIERAKGLIQTADPKYEGGLYAKQDLQILENMKNRGGLSAGEGNLYKVDIPDEYIPTMMEWDKSLGEQSPFVKKAINSLKKQVTPQMMDELGGDLNVLFGKDVTPAQFLNTLEIIHPESKVGIGEEMLNKAGVKGVKYLDNFSRDFRMLTPEESTSGKYVVGKWPGNEEQKYFDNLQEAQDYFNKNQTHNFVVFNPSTVKILEENGIPTRKELIQQQVDKLE